MFSNLNFLLVTATCFASVCTAIRVEWNTNTGPIIPPTPRTTVRPMPPFRDPAPVWEDLSNETPNPNPYIYVPPPPSRPKQRLNTNVDYNSNASSAKNYGVIVTPQTSNTDYPHKNNHNSPQVASLSAQYVPNVGTKYVAVIPTSLTKASPTSINKYSQSPLENSLSPDDKTSYKFQGKYNVKTKKYKVYEKVKYVPLNYNFSYKPSDSTTLSPSALLNGIQFHHPNLPAADTKKQSISPVDSITSTVTPVKPSKPFKSYKKHVYAKDKTIIKAKDELNDSVDKAKKS